MSLLYSNENFPFPVVVELRRLGHDVVTLSDQEKAGEAHPDAAVLAWAASMGRAVLTLNRRDFIRLHLSHPQHAGIIVCTVDPDFVGQAQRIHEAIAAENDLHGRLIRVNRPLKP